MTHKFWYSVFFSVFVGLLLWAGGCEKKESVVSEKGIKGESMSEQKKQIDSQPKMVKLETSMGDIIISLDEKAAPVTVKNFLRYVEEGFYDGVIFHRVIKGFMVQGGGFTVDMEQKKTHEQIVNEAGNNLKNDIGTIAMARTNNPNSATSQFFINHKDNDFLNYAENRNPGYAVFGKVAEGMDVVDKIAAVKTTKRNGMGDVPAEVIVIKSATVVSGQ